MAIVHTGLRVLNEHFFRKEFFDPLLNARHCKHLTDTRSGAGIYSKQRGNHLSQLARVYLRDSLVFA